LLLDRCFQLRQRGATPGSEVRSGVTTFMVMASIIFVTPTTSSFASVPALHGQGLPFAAVQAATCLVAGIMTIAMGLAGNDPLALAAGIGLNAAVAFQLIAGLKLSWQAAMGVGKLSRGKGRQVHPMMNTAAIAFTVYFALPLLSPAR
jgi:AGZA family xanthine/uracil permease-like MFS transporter